MNATDQILDVLRAAEGREVSSRALCGSLGVSRAAVWKRIETLRQQGYEIEACSRRGYRLVAAPDTPYEAEVTPLLTTRNVGRDCRYVSETGSTNRDASALGESGAPEGVVVAAGLQTAGRGRMSRVWFSPPNANLYFSVLLRPAVSPERASSLSLVAGLAVSEALAECAPQTRPMIKWPNDILIGGRKVCGILCEMQIETDCCVRQVVVGIGVNLNVGAEDLPDELKSRATSLQIEAGHRFSRAAVIAAILHRFEPLYRGWCADGFGPLAERTAARDFLFGKTISLDQGGIRIEGRVCGLGSDGALRLETARGAVSVYSGEAHINAM